MDHSGEESGVVVQLPEELGWSMGKASGTTLAGLVEQLAINQTIPAQLSFTLLIDIPATTSAKNLPPDQIS